MGTGKLSGEREKNVSRRGEKGKGEKRKGRAGDQRGSL